MLKNLIRQLPVSAIVAMLLLTASVTADDGYLPPSPNLKNIGYTQPVPQPSAPPADEISGASQQESHAVATTASTACAQTCCCQRCTADKKAALKKAAGAAYKGVFYANDFSYLDDPCYDGHLLGDNLKRLGHDGLTFEIGGQYRARVHREENHRGLGITGGDDDFLLHRIRLYLNSEIGDNVRVFAETLHADSNYESLSPRPIEENQFDLQNLFIDLTLIDNGNGKLVARGGRQEIFLGGQRYVSPLDWANTRRTFDGGRLMYSNSTWNIDGFWLATLERDAKAFDEANEDQALYGVYATNKALQNGTLDLYWLAFDDDIAGFGFDSMGARYNGTIGQFLFEGEGAYQFGQNTDGTDHDAGFFTLGLGKAFADHACAPTSWVYIDWASGDDDTGAGKGHHHFQPLAHKYNGFMDLYGRRNLVDFNILTTMQIAPKVKALLWYHNFWLQNELDTPYSVTMAPQQAGIVPADDHLGNELDFVLTVGISPRSNILFGYSRFWAGDYYDTPGLLTRFGTPLTKDISDANFFWSQYTLNF